MGGSARQRAPDGTDDRAAKDSVANVSQVVALERTLLEERVGRISRAKMELLLSGLDVVLGR